jgi:hypothetical protein
MFNCSQLFNNSSIDVLNKCLDYCDRLMSDCLCECLEDLPKDSNYLNSQRVFTIGIGVVLVTICVCLFGIKCRINYRQNMRQIMNYNDELINGRRARTIHDLSPDTHLDIERNYYNLPKYEDIIILPIELPNTISNKEKKAEQLPPNYTPPTTTPPSYETI